MFYDQAAFDIRCEWGERGMSALAPISDVVVIVDVLSFSTAVDVATGRGAFVFPYRWRDGSAVVFAESQKAALAGRRGAAGAFSLSPASLQTISAGTRLVLPSPNGATLSVCSGQTPTVCGGLRNCRAVAAFVSRLGRKISVIPAGERWGDGSLRPAVEDWVGAGAIIRCLSGTRSPEGLAAVAAFEAAAADLSSYLRACASGRQLLEGGWDGDVRMAAEHDCSSAIPLLRDGAYSNAAAGDSL